MGDGVKTMTSRLPQPRSPGVGRVAEHPHASAVEANTLEASIADESNVPAVRRPEGQTGALRPRKLTRFEIAEVANPEA